MVLGIIGICLSWIPIINNVAFVLAILAFIFGVVGIVQTKNDKKRGRGKAITAIVLAVVTVIVVIAIQSAIGKAFDDATNEVNKSSSSSTKSSSKEDKPKWDVNAVYSKIKSGMTKTEVEKITGKASDNCSETSAQYVGKMEACDYGSLGDNGIISVTYDNGKVSTKTKATY